MARNQDNYKKNRPYDEENQYDDYDDYEDDGGGRWGYEESSNFSSKQKIPARKRKPA